MQLPKKYQKYTTIFPKNGLSKRVYLLGDEYVVKLFDRDEDISKEQKLYQILSKHNLKVPRVVDKISNNHLKALIFEQLRGSSPTLPSDIQLQSICLFAHTLHKISPPINDSPFDRELLEREIREYALDDIARALSEIEVSPNSNTLIHGDLFIDNSKFIGNSLSGVYDFTDSGAGDSTFEFAVIALSWCKDEGGRLSKPCIMRVFEWVEGDFCNFLEYIGYASLFYATKRYTLGYRYDEMIRLFEEIREIKC